MQQQQQQHAQVPVNAQSHVQPLAEYHLAVPAPASSQVLQLVSQAGLQVGDLLLIEQGTLREELMQISGFGSIVLGAPLRHDHAAGSQVVIARAYQPGTPMQQQQIRNEVQRHHHQRRAIASHGGLSESVDSLVDFVANHA